MYLNIVWLCAALAALVFGVMLYSVAMFARTGVAGAASYRNSPAVEVLWALIPILILFSAAAPAVRSMTAAQPAAVASLQKHLD
jgi:cytochrome c oxidase subunit II